MRAVSRRSSCRWSWRDAIISSARQNSFERADLRNSNPIECQRYQAALEAQKRAAKAKAERAKRLALLKKKKKLAAQQAAKVHVASSK